MGSRRGPLMWEEGVLVSRWRQKLGLSGGLGHQHVVSTQPAVGIRQSKAHTAAAGRTGPRASAVLLTALSQEKLGAGGWPCSTASRILAQGAHQHDTCGLGEHGHIGLQHIIVEARCEQLAMLEPLRPLENQQAFPWGRHGRGTAGQFTQSCPTPGNLGSSTCHPA